MIEDYLIWWTSQAECEQIGEQLDEGLPVYIRDQYESRYGRPGRGRLWLDSIVERDCEDIERVAKAFAGEGSALSRYLGVACAGIVIRASDGAVLSKIPGTITDFELRRV